MKENKLNDLFEELKSYHEVPRKAEPILGTPFYRNVFTLVYGVSKIGKSHSIAQVLVNAGLGKRDVIWLDKDYNINESTLTLFSNFTHVNKNIDNVFEKLCEVEGEGTIVVIDSLKDFVGSLDIDSNRGSQQVMEKLRLLVKKKYSVICIAHATKTIDGDYSKGIKIKGNEETIKSKSDMVYKIEKHSEFREMILTDTRISGTSDIANFKLYDLGELRKKIESIIDKHDGNITVKDLTNELPSSTRNVFVKHKNELIKTEFVGKKPHQKNMAWKMS